MPLQQRAQRGVSLLELMIAMALGTGVILAATALLDAVQSSYIAVGEHAGVQDTGRYALEQIGRALRQANYVPLDSAVSATLDLAQLAPGVSGLDNGRLNSQAPGIDAPQSNAANHGSDVLAVRFFGAGDHGKADGTLLNCAGFAVAAPDDAAHTERAPSWSIFYIATDNTGEPELRCKYATRKGGWNAAAIARGVESFQVLYGVSHHDGGIQYLNAAQLSAQDWRHVIAVQVAMLIRGEQPVRHHKPAAVYHLFGPDYPDRHDQGVTITQAHLPPRLQKRIRKLFRITVRLRNVPT